MKVVVNVAQAAIVLCALGVFAIGSAEAKPNQQQQPKPAAKPVQRPAVQTGGVRTGGGGLHPNSGGLRPAGAGMGQVGGGHPNGAGPNSFHGRSFGSTTGTTGSNPSGAGRGRTFTNQTGVPGRSHGGAGPSSSPVVGSHPSGRRFGGSGPAGGAGSHGVQGGGEHNRRASARISNGHVANFRGRRAAAGGHAHAYLYHGRRFSPWYASRYRWPHGYHYVRYQVGVILPVVFWSDESFVIADYADYGLVAPDDNFEWIRYGDDALLVDTSSGAVTDVVYGAFVEQDGAADPNQTYDASQGGDPQGQDSQ